jgi:hypothetical protein
MSEGREFSEIVYRNACIARVQSLNYFVSIQCVFQHCPKAGCAATKSRHAPCSSFRLQVNAAKVLNYVTMNSRV